MHRDFCKLISRKHSDIFSVEKYKINEKLSSFEAFWGVIIAFVPSGGRTPPRTPITVTC